LLNIKLNESALATVKKFFGIKSKNIVQEADLLEIIEDCRMNKWNEEVFVLNSIYAHVLPGKWISGDTINLYVDLLRQNDSDMLKGKKIDRSSYFFYSYYVTAFYFQPTGICKKNFYYFEAISRQYNKLHSTGKKHQLDFIFDYDRLFFPIHKTFNHWTLIVIFIQQKKIIYYDSMTYDETVIEYGNNIMKIMLKWLNDVAVLTKKTFNAEEWVTDQFSVPQQNNGIDCGVFCIMFMDYIANNFPFNKDVVQNNMEKFRKIIAVTLLTNKLVYKM
jgi:Ulp1 family protease